MNTLSRKWVDILRTDDERFGHALGFGGRTTVETTTLDSLIDDYGVPFFVKIDVEGAEPQVLRGLTRAVPYVSFEVNLPEFLSEGLECVDRLEQLLPQGTFNYFISYERGLELPKWLVASEFSRILPSCDARSVDVFWRAANEDTTAASGSFSAAR